VTSFHPMYRKTVSERFFVVVLDNRVGLRVVAVDVVTTTTTTTTT